ncbi:hypothetical protein [Bacteriophage sp.]|nr:hypothetical protein [Bacteriophage sp.]
MDRRYSDAQFIKSMRSRGLTPKSAGYGGPFVAICLPQRLNH